MIFDMRFRSSRSGWMRIRGCPRRTVGAGGVCAGTAPASPGRIRWFCHSHCCHSHWQSA